MIDLHNKYHINNKSDAVSHINVEKFQRFTVKWNTKWVKRCVWHESIFATKSKCMEIFWKIYARSYLSVLTNKLNKVKNQQLFFDSSEKWGHRANHCPQIGETDDREFQLS